MVANIDNNRGIFTRQNKEMIFPLEEKEEKPQLQGSCGPCASESEGAYGIRGTSGGVP